MWPEINTGIPHRVETNMFSAQVFVTFFLDAIILFHLLTAKELLFLLSLGFVFFLNLSDGTFKASFKFQPFMYIFGPA